jgi:hypothetical protein
MRIRAASKDKSFADTAIDKKNGTSMKRQHYILFSIFISLAMLLVSCSDLKTDLPVAASDKIVVHPAGWIDTSSAAFHGKAIRAADWDMRSCRRCHGLHYTGGTSTVACTTCHTLLEGPENCTTCHGTPAPPPDLDGNTATTARGVGAHTIHLRGSGAYSATSVACTGCHHVPGSVYEAGHIDGTGRAKVTITERLASISSGGITPAPTYNPDSLRCYNTFCHGDWRLLRANSAHQFVYADTSATASITGSNYAPLWNGGAAQEACGATCHTLPPAGHKTYALTACAGCHGDVIDATGKISNKAKHINGRIDLSTNFGGEQDFR